MVQLIPQLISLICIIPLVVFWLWMFRDMTNNGYLPNNSTAPLTWPPSSKYNWTLAFIFLNVFAAAFYYVYEYRKRP
jgi:amino acid transporter